MESISLLAGQVIATIIIMKYIVKPRIKTKTYYPAITFIVSIIIALLCCLFSLDNYRNILNETIKQGIIIGATSISAYDTVIEKIENFAKRGKK